MSQPILFLVDDRPQVLEALAGDLERRFGGDHRVLTEARPGRPWRRWRGWPGDGEEVALVVAGQRMAELPGVLLLSRRTSCTRRPSGCCWWGGGSGRRPTRPCGP